MLYELDIVKEPLDIREGMLYVSDHSGLGIEVDEKLVKKFKI